MSWTDPSTIAALVTGAGTLALAGVTVWLGKQAKRTADDAGKELEHLAHQTDALVSQTNAVQKQAAASTEAVRLTRDQLRYAHMPVITQFSWASTPRGPQTDPGGQHAVRRGDSPLTVNAQARRSQ